jgi:integrase
MAKSTGRHKVEHLTAVSCRNAKPGRHADGRGLYLVVEESGTKRWLQRIVIGGKRRDLGLGGFPAVTLAEARAKALANKGEIEAGQNPLEAKREVEKQAKAVAAVPTFSEEVEEYLSFKLAEFRNSKHRDQWRSTLSTYAGPILGHLPVDQIGTAEVLRVLQPIWSDRTETASRLRGRIEGVLQHSTVKGHRAGENPARWRYHLELLLPKPSKISKAENQPALSLDDGPVWFADLRKRDGMGARALEFLALTAARSGEVRGMAWGEVDLGRAVWTIPASRMKGGREHRIPLSSAAVGLLQVLPRFAKSDLVFVAFRGGQLSDMTLSATMRRMHETRLEADQASADALLADDAGGWRDPRNRRPAVPHGLRSTFRQWAAERGFPRDMAEVALAHYIGNEVERAYQRSDMLERRRAMMQAWADFLCGDPIAKAVPLRA